jgi:enoyl-CoA hydratase
MHLNGQAYLRDVAERGTAVRAEWASPGVRVLTMDRPARLNALNTELLVDLHDALDEVAADDTCRVVVLTGAGRGFCAGVDLHEAPAPRPRPQDRSATADGPVPPQRRLAIQQAIASLVPKLRGLRQPVVAAVNGPAAGGGLALALAADVRVAAATATFNVAFVRIGLSGCDIGVSWLLPRVIGFGRSQELMLTGRIVDAAEAERIGLVNRVVPEGGALAAALETAELIAANTPMGVWMTKEVGWSQLEVASLQAGIDLENRTQVLASYTSDHREQLAAFLGRRPPRYTDT